MGNLYRNNKELVLKIKDLDMKDEQYGWMKMIGLKERTYLLI